MDDFKDHPRTIGEVRAGRDRRSTSWTPRDALIRLLREIDSGETMPSDLVIVYLEPTAEGHGQTGYFNATRSNMNALGMLSRAQFMLNQE